MAPAHIGPAISRIVTRSVEFSCGHKKNMRGPVYADKPCPNCRKKIQEDRIKHKRSLPYYLKTDID